MELFFQKEKEEKSSILGKNIQFRPLVIQPVHKTESEVWKSEAL